MSNPGSNSSNDKPKTVDNVTVEDAEDLDDLLDDVLDEFQTKANVSSSKAAEKQPANHDSTSTTTTKKDEKSMLDDALLDDDITSEGMEELIRQMGGDTDGDLQASMEQFFQHMQTGSTANDETKTSSTSTKNSGTTSATNTNRNEKPQNFQDTITETMNRLRNSSDQAKTESKTASEDDGQDALMAEMLRQMEQLTDSGEFDGLIDGMMGQLMTRDVLYEPMKELAEKYPAYLAEHKEKIPADTYTQYEQQYTYVNKFSTFNDDLAAAAAEVDSTISELMQKMQDCGQPPKELLEQLAPGMDFNEDGIPNPPDMEQCSIM
ncbi:Pex19 protein family-domain-containing protein [Syncephalis plumigaleata]|nr:Pex19 protein family-domain-containing protein [Syncephalis plumigaleata]